MRRFDADPARPGLHGSIPAVRRLTERERQVALLIAQGLKDAAIARRLGLSPSTVGNYVGHIKQRLALTSRAEIAAWVERMREIVAAGGRIDHVQVYTIARKPADPRFGPLRERVAARAAPIVEALLG